MNRLLLDEEQAAADAVLRFANLPRIKREQDVERCFSDLVDFDEFRVRRHANDGRQWLTIDLTGNYAGVQRTVRAWLALIVEGQAGRKKVAKRVASLLAESVDRHAVKPAAHVKNGQLVLTCRFANSVTAACAFGTALILDERRGLTDRLKRCRYCQRFSLFTKSKGKRGPLPEFCNEEHARLFWNKDSAKRQKRHKERLAKIARQQEKRRKTP